MSFGIWELVIILLIVALLFGTKKLKTIGSDLGGAVKGFRGAMKEAEAEEAKGESKGRQGEVIEGKVEGKEGQAEDQAARL